MQITRRAFGAIPLGLATLPRAALAQGATIKVGVPIALSGPAALYGEPALKGAVMLFVDELNKAGGVLGRKIELVVRDSKAAPDEAVRVSREMIRCLASRSTSNRTNASACSAATASARRRRCARSMGLTPPTQGKVRFKGRDVTGWSPYQLARGGIGYVPEDRRIFAELTVWENLDVAQRSTRRKGAWNIEAVYGLFPKLRELRDRAPAVCSRAASSRC